MGLFERILYYAHDMGYMIAGSSVMKLIPEMMQIWGETLS